MFIQQLNFFKSGYNLFSDIFTLKMTSYLKSTCPKMVESTLWSHL